MGAFNGAAFTVCREYRPCLVNGKKALFHQWMNMAYTIGESIAVGGPPAGQIEYTVALVEMEDGKITRAKPECIRFMDSTERFGSIAWPEPEQEGEQHNEQS